jgi:hypothetical protein
MSMRFVLNPILVIAAVTLVGAIACSVFACFASRWFKRSILIVAALVLLAPSGLALITAKPELVDARFRTYKRLYRDIQVGITRSEVMELVDRHYPVNGERLRPAVMEDSDSKLGFFMNPEESGPNCEGIFLQMQEDRVVKKEYVAD